MKIIITLILIIAIASVLSGCTSVTGETTNQETVKPSNVHEAILQIEGMTCQSCALGVEYELKQVEGVVDAKADYRDRKGYVKYDADKVDAETIAKASTVYPATVISNKTLTP